jgi:hypothetical protein
MTGYKDHNFPAFFNAADAWTDAGHSVFNPATGFDGDTSLPYSVYLKRDLISLFDCDALAVLPGWQNSRGAQLEIHLARVLEIPVYEAEYPDELIEVDSL